MTRFRTAFIESASAYVVVRYAPEWTALATVLVLFACISLVSDLLGLAVEWWIDNPPTQ